MDKLLILVDEQLDRVSQQYPNIQIVSVRKTYSPGNVLTRSRQSYIVLSGGLGSSAYVRERLRSYYITGPGSFRPAVERIEIATVEEP